MKHDGQDREPALAPGRADAFEKPGRPDADQRRGDERREKNRGPRRERLEHPVRGVGLVLVERDRRFRCAGPARGWSCWPIEATFMWVQTITTADTTIQGSQPCQGDIWLACAFGARSAPPD